MSKYEDALRDLPEAIELLRNSQGFPPLSACQLKMFEFMVMQVNSANQLATGSGKTYPAICIPLVLDILRDTFGHKHIPKTTRVLYIVPLINIFHSLVLEMKHLKIPFQVIEAGSAGEIDRDAKVVCISPEKLLDRLVMKSILHLDWSVIVVDEPHLALLWGTSKAKKKPFRIAMTELSKLNDLGTVFECHSATIVNFDRLFSFFGRKNSVWKTQIQSPNRPNLTFYLLKGPEAPENILQLPFVTNILENDFNGITLVYVQRISDGNSIFFSLLDYCEKHSLIKYSPHDRSPRKPFAFLHAKLTEESKKTILNDASSQVIKILISTSSAGCGINLPITQFVGWGLDPEPSGIIQASGRTARLPISSEGSVIWVHNAKLHGRRIPAASKVRDLLNTNECLRNTMNSWFSHGGADVPEVRARADLCCVNCMVECVKSTGCEECSRKLNYFSKDSVGVANLGIATKKLSVFLQTLHLNANRDDSSFLEENNLAREIVANLIETKDVKETEKFLSIFSLSEKQSEQITNFVSNQLKFVYVNEENTLDAEQCEQSEASDSDSLSANSEDEEYYDSEELDNF